ncbi:MAG: hypothetical protein GY765_14080, partial [bacterium]|nr:hypothetical protein [bacterium]
MSHPLAEHLTFLYGAETAVSLTARLEAILNHFQTKHPELTAEKGEDQYDRRRTGRFNEQDAILITYGDMVQAPNKSPLSSLGDFLNQWLGGIVSSVHFLPFFPYSSDDGFSVIDYWAVDPALGTWADVERVNHHFRLMFDAVINHISARSDWFQHFLLDDPHYRDYFITADPAVDLSQVFRPRTLPLLTAVST